MPVEAQVTDKLRSYGAAQRQIMPMVEHRSHKGLNNRAEHSHLPLRKRERLMQRFRSPGGLQRITSVFSAVRNLYAASFETLSYRRLSTLPQGDRALEGHG